MKIKHVKRCIHNLKLILQVTLFNFDNKTVFVTVGVFVKHEKMNGMHV